MASLAFGFAAEARAERCSIEGHERDLISFYGSAVRKGLAALPRTAGFTVNPESLILEVSHNYVHDDEFFPFPILELSGSFKTVKGTELDIFAHSQDIWWVTPAGTSREPADRPGSIIFTPTLRSQGYDHEGNPIHPRCRLTTKAWITLRNKGSGRVVTWFDLPSTITINTEKK